MASVGRLAVTAKEKDPLASGLLFAAASLLQGPVESSLSDVIMNFWGLPTGSGQIMTVVLEFGLCFRNP